MASVTGPTPFGANNSSGPGMDGFAIAPSNTNNFASMCRCIYVGGTGDVTLVTSSGTVLTFTAVPVGVFIPMCCVRVNSTGTTATSLVGLV